MNEKTPRGNISQTPNSWKPGDDVLRKVAQLPPSRLGYGVNYVKMLRAEPGVTVDLDKEVSNSRLHIGEEADLTMFHTADGDFYYSSIGLGGGLIVRPNQSFSEIGQQGMKPGGQVWNLTGGSDLPHEVTFGTSIMELKGARGQTYDIAPTQVLVFDSFADSTQQRSSANPTHNVYDEIIEKMSDYAATHFDVTVATDRWDGEGEQTNKYSHLINEQMRRNKKYEYAIAAKDAIIENLKAKNHELETRLRNTNGR